MSLYSSIPNPMSALKHALTRDPLAGLQPGGFSPVANPNTFNLNDYTQGGKAMANIAQGVPDVAGAAVGSMRPDMLSWDGLLGYVDPKTNQKVSGWGGTAISLGSALGGMWNAKKQNDLAEQTLKMNKQQFAQNYAAQRQTLNTQMQDRQAARVAANPGAYQSVGDYMNENRIR